KQALFQAAHELQHIINLDTVTTGPVTALSLPVCYKAVDAVWASMKLRPLIALQVLAGAQVYAMWSYLNLYMERYKEKRADEGAARYSKAMAQAGIERFERVQALNIQQRQRIRDAQCPQVTDENRITSITTFDEWGNDTRDTTHAPLDERIDVIRAIMTA
ncbi:hypothetical protein SARC_10919, partial [Sphaeroforma arctica JP610]